MRMLRLKGRRGEFDIPDGNASIDSIPRQPRNDTANRPQPISAALRLFLIKHEAYLRHRAEQELRSGGFTTGLSRCVDLLDNPEAWK